MEKGPATLRACDFVVSRIVELTGVWHGEKVNPCLKLVSVFVGQSAGPSSVERAPYSQPATNGQLVSWRNSDWCIKGSVMVTLKDTKYSEAAVGKSALVSESLCCWGHMQTSLWPLWSFFSCKLCQFWSGQWQMLPNFNRPSYLCLLGCSVPLQAVWWVWTCDAKLTLGVHSHAPSLHSRSIP